MKEPILCMIDDCFAYFTTQPLSKQWGDDWDDAPYDCNAGLPYEGDGWKIVTVAWDGPFMLPKLFATQHYSVENINKKHVPWLKSYRSPTLILAGTPLSRFKKLIRKDGGTIYVREE